MNNAQQKVQHAIDYARTMLSMANIMKDAGHEGSYKIYLKEAKKSAKIAQEVITEYKEDETVIYQMVA